MRSIVLKTAQLLAALSAATLAGAHGFAQDRSIFEYEVTTDVVYGSGLVLEDGQ